MTAERINFLDLIAETIKNKSEKTEVSLRYSEQSTDVSGLIFNHKCFHISNYDLLKSTLILYKSNTYDKNKIEMCFFSELSFLVNYGCGTALIMQWFRKENDKGIGERYRIEDIEAFKRLLEIDHSIKLFYLTNLDLFI